MPVQYTPEGAVTISYNTLFSDPLSLGDSLEEGFGSHPKSLGIVIVCDLPPEYKPYRERLLKLSYKFAKLPENTREKYSHAASRYSFGWSHGKEIMNGRPDILKGSYYANPIVDIPNVPESERVAHPESYMNNIWPNKDEKDIEGFEDVFKELGRFIFKIGSQLAVACQPFAEARLSDASLPLAKLIGESQAIKARLLHYFPPGPSASFSAGDEPIDSWCGFHCDHGMLTGLCSAMYLKEAPPGIEPTVVSSPSPSSGLYIRSRGGDLTKVSIPVDCLAFQTGEALQVATGEKLRATPHCVRVGVAEGSEYVSRETFALFMGPDTHHHLTENLTFGQFSKAIIASHY